jgi:phage baseplate assembly protein W
MVTQAEADNDPREHLGRDFYVNDENDFEINADDDIRRVTFYSNLQQAIIDRLRTQIGEITLHPNYGSRLPELIGTNANELTLSLCRMHVREALLQEPRISTISSISPSFRENSNQQIIDIDIVIIPIQSLEPLNLVYQLFI